MSTTPYECLRLSMGGKSHKKEKECRSFLKYTKKRNLYKTPRIVLFVLILNIEDILVN